MFGPFSQRPVVLSQREAAMESSVREFYDQLAEDYHLLFADWKRSVVRQGEVLDQLLRTQLGPTPQTVLDCCCGIGTQAIGLSLRGHRVHGTDLSPKAIERARQEAAAFGASILFKVADLRSLEDQVTSDFDAVLACDNALPHLTREHELRQAVGQMIGRLRPGGLFLASIRDYDALIEKRPLATPVGVLDEPAGRRIVFQVWDWSADGKTYQVNQFIVRQSGVGWQTIHHATHYRALLREELNSILRETGLGDLRWHQPAETGYHQPLVTASKKI
jgi:SAM-dependent methyltransferase